MPRSPRERDAARNVVVSYHPGAAAGDATEDFTILRVPNKVIVHRIDWVPNAAVTGAATNNFALSVINKGTAGAGTAVVGTAVTFASGTNATAFASTNLFNGSQELPSGSVLALRRTLNGTGLATPEGAVVVEYSRDW